MKLWSPRLKSVIRWSFEPSEIFVLKNRNHHKTAFLLRPSTPRMVTGNKVSCDHSNITMYELPNVPQ